MASRAKVRGRFWVEAALAAVTGVVTAATLFSREWVEVVFGVEPDGGGGSFEWVVVRVAGLAFVVRSGLTAAEWRRAVAA
ncbi:hypothetical protein [Saccharothrix stipae]